VRSGLDGLSTLLNVGTAVGRTDGQLLECFAAEGGDDSELAFATLVDRHGPMVLRTCRAILRDEHDARDAFQATFLILARRGGSLWVRDSVGPWLHRVARHAAIRTRRDGARRRSIERNAAFTMELSPHEPSDLDISSIIHEELDRLPERYRVPVVLCDMEGRTHEDAARHLGCPVGTVKSRLSRGRERLRDRLTRRGLALAAAFAGPVRSPLPAGLTEAATRAAARLAPSTVTGIARGVMRSMFLAQLRIVAMKATVGITIGISLFLLGSGMAARQEPGPKPSPAPAASPAPPKAAASAEPAPTFAWRRTVRYDPPDFEGFFPDDPKGGEALDALAADEKRGRRPAAEVLRTVRRGLRRTTADREEIIRWIGSDFVWEAAAQNPLAIEILYHATDFRGPLTCYGESPSIYFGLMRVEPKTPAILHAIVDWCMHIDNTMDWIWAGYCGRKDRATILSCIKPYLDSADEATRRRAIVVEKYLSESPDKGEAHGEWLRGKVQAKSGHRLPGIEKTLRNGNSRDRLAALKLILTDELIHIMGESFVDPLRACAGDEDPAVRRELASVLNMAAWLNRDRPWTDDVIEIVLRLSADKDPQVRYDAVYHGLPNPLPDRRRDDIIRRLVAVAVHEPGPDGHRQDLIRRIAWLLQGDRDAAARFLDEMLRGGDAARAEAARSVYKDLTGRIPPGSGTVSPEVRKGYVAAFRDLHEHLGKVYPSFAIKGIDWAKVGRELLPRIEAVETEEQFGLLVEELVARLEDSHACVLEGTASPPSAGFNDWGPWIDCLIDDRGRPVLCSVSPRTLAWKAGVRPGMTVVSVNGVPASEAMDRWMQHQRKYVGYSSGRYLKYDAARWFLRQPHHGDKIALELEDVDGRRLTALLRAEARGWYIPRLPVPREGIEDGGAHVQWVRLENGIGYIHVRRMQQGLEVSLDQALNALGDLKGLILDLRGNSGGGFDAETAFRNFDLAPAGTDAPHRPHYQGPIALLIDERCISAGEGWASWFVARKRARLFGTTTAGASARKEMYTLSNGMYKIQISVKAYTGFLNRPIERRGLEPDVDVRCTARDLSQGKDTVAEAAAAWLKQANRE
jgi:RNA polymerase sigma factor (sigma-70 family)